MQFIRLSRITGAHIAQAITQALETMGLDISNIRGQGYDGASNMSSGRIGVQACIKEQSPLAVYVHCSGHCLNLTISTSCNLPEVRNVLDKMKHCCRFFLLSPKRNGLLELVVSNHIQEPSKRKVLLDMCRTRWAERHIAYQHFYQAYTYIVEALEVIGHRQHLERHGDLYRDWDTQSRSEAQQILASITGFDFIVIFLMVYHYLAHLSGITVQLQGTAVDIIQAYTMISDIKHVYRKEREDVDERFESVIYTQAVRLADKVGTTPCRPRIPKRQKNRSNVPGDTVVDFYKRNVVIPFMDHIIKNLEDRFSPLAVTATSLLGLVPSLICSREIDIREATEVYHNDLPSPELVPQEVMRWKVRYENMPEEKRPATLAAAMKECDAMYFPNINVLLKIACTLPVTSCHCEHSASSLRRLSTYNRASMGQERLSSLSLLHMHYDKELDLDEVVDTYARLHPRQLELDYH